MLALIRYHLAIREYCSSVTLASLSSSSSRKKFGKSKKSKTSILRSFMVNQLPRLAPYGSFNTSDGCTFRVMDRSTIGIPSSHVSNCMPRNHYPLPTLWQHVSHTRSLLSSPLAIAQQVASTCQTKVPTLHLRCSSVVSDRWWAHSGRCTTRMDRKYRKNFTLTLCIGEASTRSQRRRCTRLSKNYGRRVCRSVTGYSLSTLAYDLTRRTIVLFSRTGTLHAYLSHFGVL